MPKELTNPKVFIQHAKGKGAKWVKVKMIDNEKFKFKLRTPKYLYTLAVKKKFVELVKKAIPENLEIKIIDEKEGE